MHHIGFPNLDAVLLKKNLDWIPGLTYRDTWNMYQISSDLIRESVPENSESATEFFAMTGMGDAFFL